MYKNLVFAGGGVKSYAYLGALKVLEENGTLANIENVAGSSAGSLYAIFVGLNFSVQEIQQAIDALDTSKEIATSSQYERMERFFTKYGLYTGDQNVEILSQIIEKKTGCRDITFRDIHDTASVNDYKNMYMTTVDLSENKLIILSYETTPDMKLVDAVRASASYPIMYTPFIDQESHYYVDGGLLNNYPINLFSQEIENTCIYNPETLGIFFSNNGESSSAIGSVLGNIADKFYTTNTEIVEQYLSNLNYEDIFHEPELPIDSIISYIQHLLLIYSKAEYYDCTVDEIEIDNNGINALDISISDDQKYDLIQSGFNAAYHFFHYYET